MSKVEGKPNFSRRLKQFDGLTRLTLTTHILGQIYANAHHHYTMTGLVTTDTLKHMQHICTQLQSEQTNIHFFHRPDGLPVTYSTVLLH